MRGQQQPGKRDPRSCCDESLEQRPPLASWNADSASWWRQPRAWCCRQGTQVRYNITNFFKYLILKISFYRRQLSRIQFQRMEIVQRFCLQLKRRTVLRLFLLTNMSVLSKFIMLTEVIKMSMLTKQKSTHAMATALSCVLHETDFIYSCTTWLDVQKNPVSCLKIYVIFYTKFLPQYNLQPSTAIKCNTQMCLIIIQSVYDTICNQVIIVSFWLKFNKKAKRARTKVNSS